MSDLKDLRAGLVSRETCSRIWIMFCVVLVRCDLIGVGDWQADPNLIGARDVRAERFESWLELHKRVAAEYGCCLNTILDAV
jgi:hypothetical protein